MWIFRYGIPVLAILGFGHSAYEVFTGKVDAKAEGLTPEHLRMFGLLVVIQALGWALVIVGLRMGASWWHSLAIFNTGLFTFDYLVSLPSFRMIGDKAFKYWAGVALLLQFLFILWA
jgi:hypothetical protein